MKKKTKQSRLPVLIILCVLVAVVLAVFLLCREDKNNPAIDPTGESNHQTTVPPATVNGVQDIRINIGYGLYITKVGGYTGTYMEDGSDALVSGVTMILVENAGENDIQYAEILLAAGKEEVCFALSTLPAGEKVVLLEKDRKGYRADVSYSSAVARNVVVFDLPLTKLEDRLEIQFLGGMMNVKNISHNDIRGTIVIYYKNCAAGVLYGGITYRLTIEGGLAAGEIRQVPGSHISEKGSEIMFITVG